MIKHDKEAIASYYASRESRWGYQFFLGGNKHYGYYPVGVRLSLKKAEPLMSTEIGKELGLPPGAKVLDAGCGEGHSAIHIVKKFGFKIEAIDLLEPSIQMANQNKQKESFPFQGEVAFKVMDFSKLEYPDNYFDGIYTLESLLHASDCQATLKEFYRVLKPGGVLVNHDYVLPDKLSSRDNRIFKVIYDGSGMNTLDDFRESQMKGIWKDAGFEYISSYNGIKEITPMMKKLYHLAYIPYYLVKLFGQEEKHVNTYSGIWVYRLRHLIRYNMMRSYKPNNL